MQTNSIPQNLLGFLRYLYANRNAIATLINNAQATPISPTTSTTLSSTPIPGISNKPNNALSLDATGNYFVPLVSISTQIADNLENEDGTVALSAKQGTILNRRVSGVENLNIFTHLTVLDNVLLYKGIKIATHQGLVVPEITELPTTPFVSGKIAVNITEHKLAFQSGDKWFQLDPNAVQDKYYKYNYDGSLPATVGGENSFAIAPGASALGTNSMSWGVESLAAAEGSMAKGVGAIAKGEQSLAWGGFSLAQKDYTLAFGFASQALGINSVASGHEAIASGAKSYAAGYQARALADGAIQLGQGSNNKALTLQFLDKAIATRHGLICTTGIGQPEFDAEDGSLYVDKKNRKFYFRADGVWLVRDKN